MPYNTLKKRKLAKAIATSSTIREAATKAGYSPISRAPYQKYNKLYIEKLLNLDKGAITEKFIRLGDKAEAQGDNTNAIRATEDLSRLGGLFTDRQVVDATIRTQEEDALLSKHRNRLAGLIPKQNESPL